LGARLFAALIGLEGVAIMADDMLDPVLEALLRRLFDHTHELFNEGHDSATVAHALLANAVTAYGHVHGTKRLAQQLAQLCIHANAEAGGHALPSASRH
jgi:hypothetical protein